MCKFSKILGSLNQLWFLSWTMDLCLEYSLNDCMFWWPDRFGRQSAVFDIAATSGASLISQPGRLSIKQTTTELHGSQWFQWLNAMLDAIPFDFRNMQNMVWVLQQHFFALWSQSWVLYFTNTPNYIKLHTASNMSNVKMYKQLFLSIYHCHEIVRPALLSVAITQYDYRGWAPSQYEDRLSQVWGFPC